MEYLLKILFALNFSLILLHEMDAIRKKEWKLFIFLKDLKEEVAYRFFTGLHFPLYFIIILLLITGVEKYHTYISIGLDIFLIFHSIIHYAFRNKVDNKFNNMFSNLIINIAAVSSFIHMLIYLSFR